MEPPSPVRCRLRSLILIITTIIIILIISIIIRRLRRRPPSCRTTTARTRALAASQRNSRTRPAGLRRPVPGHRRREERDERYHCLSPYYYLPGREGKQNKTKQNDKRKAWGWWMVEDAERLISIGCLTNRLESLHFSLSSSYFFLKKKKICLLLFPFRLSFPDTSYRNLSGV